MPLFPSALSPDIQAAMVSTGPFHGGPVFEVGDGSETTRSNSSSTQLLELKARGRFGAVWRAQCGLRIVAVKTFSIQVRSSQNTTFRSV